MTAAAGAAGVAGVLVEEHLDGPVYDVQTLSANGRHRVMGVTRALFGPEPLVVPTGHVYPVPGDEQAGTAGEAAARLLARAGYRTGPAQVRIRLTALGPRLVSARAGLPGDRITRLLELATGADLERSALRALHGRLDPAPGLPHQVAGLRFLDLPAGRVLALGDLPRARALPFVDEVDLPFAVGDRIPPAGHSRSRRGHVLVTAINHAQLERRLRQVHRLVREAVRVVPDLPTGTGRAC